MSTRKNNEEKSELATPQNVMSSQSAGHDGGRIQIVCLNFPDDAALYAGAKLELKVVPTVNSNLNLNDYHLTWTTNRGSFEIAGELLGQTAPNAGDTIRLTTYGPEGSATVTVTPSPKGGSPNIPSAERAFRLREPKTSDLKYNFDQKMDQVSSNLEGIGFQLRNGVNVSLQRAGIEQTSDLALWVVIRESTRAMSFANYQRFTDMVLCGTGDPTGATAYGDLYAELRTRRFLPFNDTDAYRLLKTATEAFLLVNAGVALEDFVFSGINLDSPDGINLTQAQVEDYWNRYLTDINGNPIPTIPYLWLIANKMGGEPFKKQIFRFEDPRLGRDQQMGERCEGVLRSKVVQPFLIELIWSYWQEEGMLAQSLNAIGRRFQNIRNPRGDRDPLVTLEIDALRPLNNLLWGYIQDEQHRLSVVRRAYEYDHHYGFSIEGRAVPQLRSADSRSKFLEAFHQLLHLCTRFFKQDDDTTVRADAFPILNALREVHLILAQGAHNQFGDLPSTARQEMLMQQWLLARPEFREFLPSRAMVAYPEPWMDRVDAMKTLQGWTDTSVMHFHNLAVFGEQLLLSIRYGAWSQTETRSAQASNWARFWRAQIQSYLHSYRAATGVDLALPMRGSQVDIAPPSVHLRNRLGRRA